MLLSDIVQFGARRGMAELKEVVSASLIRTAPLVPLSSEEKKKFCLGLVGWCPCEDLQSTPENSIEAFGSVTDGLKESITTQESATNRAKAKYKKSNSDELAANSDCLEPCRKTTKCDCSEQLVFKVMPDQLSKLKEGICPANTLKNNT